MRKFLGIATILLALSTPAFAQKADIQKSNARFIELFNKGDFAGIATLYTADAVVLPPDAGIVKGRDAIAGMWKVVATKVAEPSLTTADIKRLSPKSAREIGTFTLKTKGANPQQLSGKYVVVWEKVRGEWKLSTDIWNSGQ
jgi:uncharacterized protein (TIGR02246 family)